MLSVASSTLLTAKSALTNADFVVEQAHIAGITAQPAVIAAASARDYLA
jgi:hypothetical protein